jgi:hypothetical protein
MVSLSDRERQRRRQDGLQYVRGPSAGSCAQDLSEVVAAWHPLRLARWRLRRGLLSSALTAAAAATEYTWTGPHLPQLAGKACNCHSILVRLLEKAGAAVVRSIKHQINSSIGARDNQQLLFLPLFQGFKKQRDRFRGSDVPMRSAAKRRGARSRRQQRVCAQLEHRTHALNATQPAEHNAWSLGLVRQSTCKSIRPHLNASAKGVQPPDSSAASDSLLLPSGSRLGTPAVV